MRAINRESEMSATRLSVVETNGNHPPLRSELFSQIVVLGERQGGLIEAMVPVELINREEVPVNQTHVDELVASMESEAKEGSTSGQLSPVLLGEVADESTFRIIDGFHRDAALHQKGESHVFATIRPNSTYEEILDLRILTAATHQSVSFARIIEWVGDAWDKSPWVDKISVSQAFRLTQTNSSGKILKLSPEEAEDVKAWVKDKCAKWRMQAASINNSLITAEVADPQLIKKARHRPGGRKLTEITPQHLGVIANGLPHRYDEQNLVAGIAIANNFNLQHTRAVVEAIKHTRTAKEAARVLAGLDLSKIKAVYGRSRARELQQEVAEKDEKAAQVHNDYLATEVELGKAKLENLALRGLYVACLEGSQERQQFIVGDTTPQIDRILAAPSSPSQVDRLLSRVEAVEDTLLNMLQSKAGISIGKAKNLLNQAVEIVVDDIEKGPLQFVDLSQPGVFDHLVRNSLNALLRSRQQGQVKTADAAPEPPQVSMEAAVSLFPEMNARERRMFVLHGFMRTHPYALQQIAGIDFQTSQRGLARIADKATARDLLLQSTA